MDLETARGYGKKLQKIMKEDDKLDRKIRATEPGPTEHETKTPEDRYADLVKRITGLMPQTSQLYSSEQFPGINLRDQSVSRDIDGKPPLHLKLAMTYEADTSNSYGTRGEPLAVTAKWDLQVVGLEELGQERVYASELRHVNDPDVSRRLGLIEESLTVLEET